MQPRIVLDYPLVGYCGSVIGLSPSVQECLLDIQRLTVVYKDKEVKAENVTYLVKIVNHFSVRKFDYVFHVLLLGFFHHVSLLHFSYVGHIYSTPGYFLLRVQVS